MKSKHYTINVRNDVSPNLSNNIVNNINTNTQADVLKNMLNKNKVKINGRGV